MSRTQIWRQILRKLSIVTTLMATGLWAWRIQQCTFVGGLSLQTIDNVSLKRMFLWKIRQQSRWLTLPENDNCFQGKSPRACSQVTTMLNSMFFLFWYQELQVKDEETGTTRSLTSVGIHFHGQPEHPNQPCQTPSHKFPTELDSSTAGCFVIGLRSSWTDTEE